MYAQGNPGITSKKQNIVSVVVPQMFKSNERMRIYVQVGNGTSNQYWFAPDSVSVSCSNNGEVLDRHVFTYEELVSEERSRQMWAAIAVALAGASNAMAAQNAGYSYTTGTYSGSFSGNIYSTPSASFGGTYSGMYTERTYNPYVAQLAQQQAQAQTQRQLQALEAAGNRAMHDLGRTILRTNTVSPGQICGGVIEIESPIANDSEEEMNINVSIGNEQHSMRFRVTKVD